MNAGNRTSKLALPQRRSAMVNTVIFVAGIAGPLLLLAAGLWAVFNLVRFLVGILG